MHRSGLEFLRRVAWNLRGFPVIDDNEVPGSLLECASQLRQLPSQFIRCRVSIVIKLDYTVKREKASPPRLFETDGNATASMDLKIPQVRK